MGCKSSEWFLYSNNCAVKLVKGNLHPATLFKKKILKKVLFYETRELTFESSIFCRTTLCDCVRKKIHFVFLIFYFCNLDFPMFEKLEICTARKMNFSIKDYFSKCDQIRSFLRIWSHLQKKSLMENFIFCAVLITKSNHDKSRNVTRNPLKQKRNQKIDKSIYNSRNSKLTQS